VPAVGMGAALLVFHFLDRTLAVRLGVLGGIWPALRAVVISISMASLIAWLAVRHRREYEAVLGARSETLEATRDFLERIIEGSGEAIVTLDRQGRVTSWNRAAEQIYGWTAPEMLGHAVERLFPDDAEVRRDWEDSQRSLAAGRTIREHECTRLRKDGSRIRVRITRSPLYDASGRLIGSTGIIRDVTALKRMEARLVERERLAAVGELAAQVAHEIRNPLAGIRGACEILSDGYAEDDPRNGIAAEVLRQVDRLNRTVEDLLSFARPKAVRAVPTDLHKIIDRTLGVLLEDPRAHAIDVDRRYCPDLPALLIDPRQLEQVFINLFLNAFQAMSYRGTITVATRVNGSRAEVSVRDTGPGIEPALQDKIFKPFFTTRSQGSGLGLAIVRNLVQAHGGSVEVDADSAGGAVFRILLPKEGPAP
jgi:PAS domain S-box-containing protein